MQKSNISLIKTRTSKRVRIVMLTFLLFASFLVYNVFYLCFFRYAYYTDKVFDQITTSSPMRAERGTIYDSNMNPLAVTKTTWRVFVSTKEIKKYEKKFNKNFSRAISDGLADILSLDKDALYTKITSSNVLDVTVKKSASEEEYEKIIDFIQEYELEELIFTEAQSSRYYPMQTMAAHVLGFTGSDNQGLYGLEYYYNSTFSAKDGYYLYAKDAGGGAMPGGYSTYTPPEDGLSLVTTLDTYLQAELEEQLEIIRQNHTVNNRVTGVVMDANTGAILAMATSSPFNPNSPYTLDSVSMSKLIISGFEEGSDEYKKLKTELMQVMWSNKAVSETYEPGSTFKIVTVSAALDSGKAKTDDTFSCHGYHTVGGWRIKCHKVKGHGSGFDLAYGLQMSCNPTMMTLAERMGSDTFYSYVEKFGYFKKTGIDLPSEAGCIFHEKENMGSTELATASFGQRFKVSIISQLRAVAAVANGGKLVEPYVVEKIIDSQGKTVSQHELTVVGSVVSEETANTVSDILEAGVSGDGGAKNAYVEGYYVAAKTGTSEKFDVLDENGRSYLRVGSTVAFAKSENRSIAMIIVVDEPQSQVKYGSVVAAPYISAYLSEALPYLEYTCNKESDSITLNDYVGMNTNTVKKELASAGIEYTVIGDGDVIVSQVPASGVDISLTESKIYLYTVKREGDTVTVPNLSGLSAREANIAAQNLGLNVKFIGVTDREYRERLKVVSQTLIPGDSVPKGTLIELTVLKTDFED